jgi:peptide/nickel transport system permease protein
VTIFLLLLRRLAATVPVLVAVALIAFVLLRISAGDPVAQLAGDNATPENVAAIRARLGLDQPLIVQFLQWGWRLLHGDLGTSIVSGVPVLQLIGQRTGPTIAVSLLTVVVSVVVGVPLGVYAAWRRGGFADHLASSIATAGLAIPTLRRRLSLDLPVVDAGRPVSGAGVMRRLPAGSASSCGISHSRY